MDGNEHKVSVFLLPSPHSAGRASVCQRWLDASERRRAAAIARAADRAEFIAAHALLRAALTRVAAAHGIEASPRAWRFDTTPRGKPHLRPGTAPLDLRFSLSHCNGLVAAAVSVGREVGVDVEREGRYVARPLWVARARFSSEELVELEAIPEVRAQRRRFMAMWIRMEALAKATGLGLAMRRDTRRPAGTRRRAGTRPDVHRERRAAWHFSHWRLGAHLIVLATGGPQGGEPPVGCHVLAWNAPRRAFVEALKGRRAQALAESGSPDSSAPPTSLL